MNAPEVWWFQGDEGNTSSPGGWLRVFGRSLAAVGDRVSPAAVSRDVEAAVAAGDYDAAERLLADARAAAAASSAAPATLRLASTTTSRTFDVVANESDSYHAWFNLPGDLPEGTYVGTLSNGLGGPGVALDFFESPEAPSRRSVTVVAPKAWKADVFEVDCDWAAPVFERPCGWVGARSDEALTSALKAARANGGGVVLLPRGQYYVDGPVVVPDGVRLRGAGRELVSLYFKEAPAPGDAPKPGYVYGDGAVPGHRWAVEDLSIYVTNFHNSVLFVAPTCDRFVLQRTRVRAAPYAFLGNPDPHSATGNPNAGNRGMRSAQFEGTQLGELVYLAGNRNYDILDNDLLGANILIHTGQNPGSQASARYGRIARNELYNGNAAHWFDDIKECIFEDNVIKPGGAFVTWGNNIDNYGATYCQHVYHARNSFEKVWANDREVMTFDAVSGSYMGPVVALDAQATTIALDAAYGTSDISQTLGGAVTVLAGPGAGQYRRVVAAPDAAHVTVDRPFATPLDSTSQIAVGAFKGQIIFHRNTYKDSGSFQTYGTAQDVIVADHTFERVEALISWGRTYGGHAYAPNVHVEFVRNTVLEGNHLWNYNGSYPYPHPKTLEPYSIGVLATDQASQPCPPYPHGPKNCHPSAELPFQGALNHQVILRKNLIKNNGGIAVRGYNADVLVADNVILDSPVGVHVNTTAGLGPVLVVGNQVPNATVGVEPPPFM